MVQKYYMGPKTSPMAWLGPGLHYQITTKMLLLMEGRKRVLTGQLVTLTSMLVGLLQLQFISLLLCMFKLRGSIF